MPLTLEQIDAELSRRGVQVPGVTMSEQAAPDQAQPQAQPAPNVPFGVEAIDAELEKRGVPPNLDTKTGAPKVVRSVVGGFTGENKLKVLKQFYPDAIAFGDDNFVYTNPETGKPTVYNPKGFDIGDIMSLTKEGYTAVGSGLGAMVGTAAGPAGSVAGAGLGGAAGGAAFDVAASKYIKDPRSTGEQAKDLALEAGGSAAGQKIGEAVGAGVREGVKRVFRGGEAGRKEAGQAISDLAPFGVSPSTAQATQQPLLDSFESFLSTYPGSAGKIRTVARNTAETVGESVTTKAQALAGKKTLEPEVAGGAIKRGVSTFADEFKAKAGTLYSEFDNYVAPDDMVPYVNLKQTVDNLAGRSELAQAFAGETMRKVKDIVQKTNSPLISFEDLKDVRSIIGAKLSSFDLVSDVPRADLKRLYAALSQDMADAADIAGPDAVKALNNASKYWAAGIKRIDDVLEPLVGNKTPERIFAALESGGKQGATVLRAARRSLPEEDYKVVVGTMMERLGKAAPGQQGAEGAEFSFGTFLTNWNKLPRSSKEALFDGPGMGGTREALDSLARASERIRESSKAFANPSGTGGKVGQTMMAASTVYGAVGAGTGDFSALLIPLGFGMSAVGANGVARLMTSPKFVQWLAKSTEVDPNGFAAHVGRLSGIAASSDPRTAEAIQKFAGSLADTFDRIE